MRAYKQRKDAKLTQDPTGANEEFLLDTVAESIWNICQVANAFVFPIYANFERDYEITRMEFVVMYVLHHHPELVSSDIVRVTALPKNNVSRGVRKLLQKGLIKSGGDPVDSRRRILSLTDTGAEMMMKLIPVYQSRALGFLDQLDDSERKALNSLMRKLVMRVYQSP